MCDGVFRPHIRIFVVLRCPARARGGAQLLLAIRVGFAEVQNPIPCQFQNEYGHTLGAARPYRSSCSW